MDTNGRMIKILNNRRGVATVYIALMLMVLIAFVGMAVDLGYMYVAKGQLQNAADSAALAGAAKLNGSAFTIQTSARRLAVNFAGANVAATGSVVISSDFSNDLSANNDITVGNWNRNLSPKFSTARTPINAVQVRARRTGSTDAAGASIGGQVDLFLSNVFGRPRMSASAEAIAARVPSATSPYFMIGRQTCSTSLPRRLYIGPDTGNPTPTSSGEMAWTSFLATPTAPGFNVSDLICGKTTPNVEVCNQPLYSTQGTGNSVYQDIEADFYDPYYDAGNKEFQTDALGNFVTDRQTGDRIVTKWTVSAPVTETNNPGLQGPNDPHVIWGYAKIRISRACGSGGGMPCGGARRYFAPSGVCTGGGKFVEIDQITCVDCASSAATPGIKPKLVQ
ncbi:hypothetical protein KI811_05300 [Geobacter hydrogenophilus]|uniref:pilus assembly protein TadG-related protein n=1 Tax=Geobacter hydrogenophilus TaxID=40983 RepID=UPI001BDB5510|nr:pilus assembly protein TadG-related protein [Geobacter hydrogenophilus]MBT0893230.1 hypothetical protein [Geobacter hydrogenophilus]